MRFKTVPRKAYPSDLTDEQWSLLEPLLPLCANMTETLAPLFITVEGQEGTSHGKGYEQARAPGGPRP